MGPCLRKNKHVMGTRAVLTPRIVGKTGPVPVWPKAHSYNHSQKEADRALHGNFPKTNDKLLTAVL